MIDLKTVTPADLTWPFADGLPRYHHDDRDSTIVDPFPGYMHDLDLVIDIAERCAEVWPPTWPVTYHVASLEDVGRTNGWSSYEYVLDDTGDNWVPGRGHVFLSGKRIPPHPAVTRYVVAHEYGHQVQWFIEQHRGQFGEDDLLAEYAELRGMTRVRRYGGGEWHRHVNEVFACDFRVVLANVEPDYWPHQGVVRPHQAKGVLSWWADALQTCGDVSGRADEFLDAL